MPTAETNQGHPLGNDELPVGHAITYAALLLRFSQKAFYPDSSGKTAANTVVLAASTPLYPKNAGGKIEGDTVPRTDAPYAKQDTTTFALPIPEH